MRKRERGKEGEGEKKRHKWNIYTAVTENKCNNSNQVNLNERSGYANEHKVNKANQFRWTTDQNIIAILQLIVS